MFILTIGYLVGLMIFLITLSVLALVYDYKHLIDFRPHHHLLIILILFWDNVLLYSLIIKYFTHIHGYLCLLGGYLIGSLLHHKALSESFNTWRLNNGEK